jgi:hypothetical protein
MDRHASILDRLEAYKRSSSAMLSLRALHRSHTVHMYIYGQCPQVSPRRETSSQRSAKYGRLHGLRLPHDSLHALSLPLWFVHTVAYSCRGRVTVTSPSRRRPVVVTSWSRRGHVEQMFGCFRLEERGRVPVQEPVDGASDEPGHGRSVSEVRRRWQDDSFCRSTASKLGVGGQYRSYSRSRGPADMLVVVVAGQIVSPLQHGMVPVKTRDALASDTAIASMLTSSRSLDPSTPLSPRRVSLTRIPTFRG